MFKLLIITGPTATGKTSLGIELAKKLSGEIISADSRQVYKFMDIGTGKDVNLYEKAGVKVWGIDLVDPDYPFNVSEWVKFSIGVIREIRDNGKLPIIVGGTGLYIKELLYPSETLHVPSDTKLRSQLADLTVKELQKELQRVDPDKWCRMNKSDKHNPRRLVRAIEVAIQNPVIASARGTSTRGNLPNEGEKIATSSTSPRDDNTLIIGLTAPQKDLYQRIDARVEERISQGFEEEKEKLARMGYVPNAIGYLGESAQVWKIAEHHYARRQLTYLKKLPGITWFDVTSNYRQKIIAAVGKWYTKQDGGQKNQAGNR